MADINKKRQTIPIYCPECAGKTRGKPHILCIVEEENGDILIRCKSCKTDVNISQLLRKTS